MVDPSVWVKIYIDGVKVVDEKVYRWSVQGLGEEHLELVSAADHLGKKWLVEVIDPDAPPEEAHLRFGNDTKGMVNPIQLLKDGEFEQRLDEELQRRYGPR